MKKLILFTAVLLSICSTAQVAVAPASTSTFIISFKVAGSDDIHKVTGAQITIHHEEQWSNFKKFKAAAKQSKVLSFDGKSVGNTIVGLLNKKGVEIEEMKIKCLETNKSIRLKGATLKSMQKKGSRFLTEIEYLSVK